MAHIQEGGLTCFNMVSPSSVLISLQRKAKSLVGGGQGTKCICTYKKYMQSIRLIEGLIVETCGLHRKLEVWGIGI